MVRSSLCAAVIAASSFQPSPVQAASRAACAIWLCLPGGFPTAACAPAYREFIRRITRIPPRPPLPAFGGCADNSDGIHYDQGYRRFDDCHPRFDPWDTIDPPGDEDAHQLPVGEEGNQRHLIARRCVRRSLCYWEHIGDDSRYVCPHFYRVARNPRPHYITMYLDGQVCGPFHYSFTADDAPVDIDYSNSCRPR